MKLDKLKLKKLVAKHKHEAIRVVKKYSELLLICFIAALVFKIVL